MATVTGFTAARMTQIENETVVDGDVVGDDLILTRRDGVTINAGNVRGPQGIQGLTGQVPEAPNDGDSYVRENAGWVKFPRTLYVANAAAIPASGSEIGQELIQLDKGWKFYWTGTEWRLLHPVLISNDVFNVSPNASTVYQTYVDGRNKGAAPCDGILVAEFVGRGGFNASGVTFEYIIQADNTVLTTGTDAGQLFTATATAAAFVNAAGSDAHTYSKGQTMGHAIMLKSSLGTGQTHLVGSIRAVFYPENLFGL